MTTPDGYTPEGAQTVSGIKELQNLNEAAIKKQLQQPAVDLFGKFKNNQLNLLASVVNFFGSAMLGSWNRVNPEAISIEDGQLKINERTDLLSGVNGYCCAYQSLNITTGKVQASGPWGFFKSWSADERMLPYDRPVGPSKGAHVDDAGIVFDQEGLWTVYVLCRRKKPSSTLSGNPISKVTAHVYDANGDPYANREFAVGTTNSDYRITNGDQRLSGSMYQDSDTSVTMVFPVVIPAPGYRVTVGVRDSQQDSWWLGGTDYSTLAVLKHDNRTENPGSATVPDEPV